MTRSITLLSTALCFTFVSHAFTAIAIKSEYEYNQQGVVSFVGSEEVVGSIERTVNLPNAIYKFDIQSDSDDVYELKSKAKIEANIDGRAVDGFSGDGWQNTKVDAISASQLVDTTIVDGLQGEVGGLVEFVWDVTGSSTISIDPKLSSDAYLPKRAFTTAFFNTIEESTVPELLINNQSKLAPGPGVTSIDSQVPGFFEPVVAFVDWIVGEELDVFFELQTHASLEVENFDAAGFEATLDSDFSNTAVLKEIRIFDEDGNLIPDAYLRSTEDDFIYDPAGLGLGSDDNGQRNGWRRNGWRRSKRRTRTSDNRRLARAGIYRGSVQHPIPQAQVVCADEVTREKVFAPDAGVIC